MQNFALVAAVGGYGKPNAGFNPNVHGARGALAFAVLLFHVANSGLPTAPVLAEGLLKAFSLSLQFGVELFFCISGYVISGTLRRAASPFSFFVNRLIRILPVLWATMPFVLLMEYYRHVLQIEDKWFVPVLIANLLCFPTIIPVPLFHYAAWSMSYELTFYAMAAVAAFMWKRGRAQSLLVVPPAILLLLLYPRAIFFLPGLLVAEGILDRFVVRPLTRFPLVFLAIFLAAWSQVMSGDLQSSMVSWSASDLLLGLAAVLAAGFAFRGIVAGVGVVGLLLRNPILQFLGTISYSLYMWQFVTMAIVKHAMLDLGMVPVLGAWSQAAFLAITLPPTLIVSWASQLLIEKRGTEWLRRRARRYVIISERIPVSHAGAPLVSGHCGDESKAYESGSNVT